jgi:hypothetical protein
MGKFTEMEIVKYNSVNAQSRPHNEQQKISSDIIAEDKW